MNAMCSRMAIGGEPVIGKWAPAKTAPISPFQSKRSFHLNLTSRSTSVQYRAIGKAIARVELLGNHGIDRKWSWAWSHIDTRISKLSTISKIKSVPLSTFLPGTCLAFAIRVLELTELGSKLQCM
jgi:hypothetical protein